MNKNKSIEVLWIVQLDRLMTKNFKKKKDFDSWTSSQRN